MVKIVADNEMTNVYKACKKGELHIIEVTQSIENLPHYPFKPISRSDDHRYKSNNWLKQHGKAMRRKPFKRGGISYLIDEFHAIGPIF